MTFAATAKAKVYIGTPSATIEELEDFEEDTYVEINEVEDLGEWGAEAREITFANLANSHVRRRKGTVDSGSVSLVCARDPADPGQNIARAAAASQDLPIAFKVTLNDKPTVDGTPTTFYFRAVVLSARNSFGSADDITKTTFTLGIDGAIIELPAAVVTDISPDAGALTGGTEDVPYSQTITGSGGIGTVSYAVTAGSLPAGLALNASTGAITGTPTEAGSSSFTITATWTGSGSASAAYTLAIAGA